MRGTRWLIIFSMVIVVLMNVKKVQLIFLQLLQRQFSTFSGAFSRGVSNGRLIQLIVLAFSNFSGGHASKSVKLDQIQPDLWLGRHVDGMRKDWLTKQEKVRSENLTVKEERG